MTLKQTPFSNINIHMFTERLKNLAKAFYKSEVTRCKCYCSCCSSMEALNHAEKCCLVPGSWSALSFVCGSVSTLRSPSPPARTLQLLCLHVHLCHSPGNCAARREPAEVEMEAHLEWQRMSLWRQPFCAEGLLRPGFQEKLTQKKPPVSVRCRIRDYGVGEVPAGKNYTWKLLP